MRKIAIQTHTALLETIDAANLTPEIVASFAKLADLILRGRAGGVKSVGDVIPAMEHLVKLYPKFTVNAAVIRRIDVTKFYDTVIDKNLENRNAPQNLEILRLPAGTYYGTTTREPAEIVRLSGVMNSQFPGELHMMFSVGEQTGFQYEQLRSLMIANADVLVKGAGQNQGLAQQIAGTLASLKRAKLILPHTAIIKTRNALPLHYNDLLGVIDFQVNKGGQFIEKRKFWEFYQQTRQLYKQNRLNGPLRLTELRGKTAVMIGRPPSGWSTDRFSSALRPYGISVFAQFEFKTRLAFYDPASAPADQLNEAKRRGMQLIPYQDVISALSL